MKKLLIGALISLILTGCNPKKEVVEIYKGDPGLNGTSCSVAQELDSETSEVLGAKISCTDGTFATILNGATGAQGIQGEKGDQGIQGPVGQTGAAAKSCQTFKKKYVDGVYLQCPGKKAVLISNGKDGESCSSTRQDSKSRVKITCGESVSYVYDGKNGQDGTSCSATPTEGGAYINCGDNKPVFLADGENGIDGEDGVDGTNCKDAIQPGLLCQVYDSQSIDRSNGLLRILANATSKFEVVVNQLDTGDTQSSMGYPKFTPAQQAMIGTEDYAMDCSGYLNVPISGNYLFHLFSDDGSKLAIKDALVIDFDGLHSPQEKSSESNLLYKGPNKINVLYFQGPNTQIALDLDWTGPNFSRQQLPAVKLTH